MNHSPLPEDLQRCVEFHGHLCPGLVIGYCAAKAGMAALAAERSRDEELVAVVENDSCAADAVQVLTGCTFGKGNLTFRDYGKMVFTFALRPSGRAVRLSLAPAAPPDLDDVPEEQRRDRRIAFLLSEPPERLFAIRRERLPLPHEAEIRETVPCERCGEGVMATRLVERNGKRVCIPCAEAMGGERK